jgi:hypothetical protein
MWGFRSAAASSSMKATSLAHARLLAAPNEFSRASLFTEGYSMMAGGSTSIPNCFDTETK